MKKTTTKSAVFLLILSLLLSACQSKSTDTLPSTPTATLQKTATRTPTKLPTTTPTQTRTPEWQLPLSDLDEIELLFTHPWTGELANTIDQLVDTFNQTNEYSIFVRVNTPGSSQQLFQQSETGLRNDSGPNVVIAPIEELAYWYQFEYLLELDKFVNDANYGFDSDLIEDFLPLFWEQDTLDDHRLGIPVSRNANFLIMNTTWANELEFNLAALTPQIFRTQVCTARDILLYDDDWRNNGMGGWIVKQDEYTTLNWMNSFQLSDFPTTETPYLFDQPATLDAFTYLREIFDDDCTWNARNPTHYEYLVNRQALYISADMYDLESISKTFIFLESEDQWQVAAYPQVQGKPELLTHGDSLGILKSNPEQELASWLFVRWFSMPEQQLKLAKVNPAIPVSQSILSQISKDRTTQWNQVIALLPDASPAPRTAEWRVARFILQDAVFQIYLANITPDQYPQIISLLDSIISDLSQQPASPGWE